MNLKTIQILWVDDEVDLLKPHILFLLSKGYQVTSCNNGLEAIELVQKNRYEAVLLDENMPGLNGLETLYRLKNKQPKLPVIMVTKNEEEHIMEDAIGSKISDYLIKPVNPNQILLSLKKNLLDKNLIAEKTSRNYQQEFRKINLELMDLKTVEEWQEFYQKMIFWELELESLVDHGMIEIFQSQMKEANQLFSKFVKESYENWIINPEEAPELSHGLFKNKIKPLLKDNQPTLLLVIDNLRLDQWKTIEPFIIDFYQKEKEDTYFSILPTATQYARNSLFSGLTPLEISLQHPQWWKNDPEEGGKNLFEKELLAAQLKRLNIEGKMSYHKITNIKNGKLLAKSLADHKNEKLTTVVYNFVDMISHAKSEMEIIKELASDDKAYRSLTGSWFKNSPLLEIISAASEYNYQLILTTDHGTINVTQAIEVIGDKESSLNLRYKTGRSLTYNSNKVFEVNEPKNIGLPKISINSKFIFALDYSYFVYPKNFHHYAALYNNSYQHGGISMEEIIIPFVVLKPKSNIK
ncbi:MAG: PglZ domain-containing protein [Flavobacteriaceae bacterium]|nr:PglZ domain-containing protein [Flavobacteriaceae bacterium]